MRCDKCVLGDTSAMSSLENNTEKKASPEKLTSVTTTASLTDPTASSNGDQKQSENTAVINDDVDDADMCDESSLRHQHVQPNEMSSTSANQKNATLEGDAPNKITSQENTILDTEPIGSEIVPTSHTSNSKILEIHHNKPVYAYSKPSGSPSKRPDDFDDDSDVVVSRSSLLSESSILSIDVPTFLKTERDLDVFSVDSAEAVEEDKVAKSGHTDYGGNEEHTESKSDGDTEIKNQTLAAQLSLSKSDGVSSLKESGQAKPQSAPCGLAHSRTDSTFAVIMSPSSSFSSSRGRSKLKRDFSEDWSNHEDLTISDDLSDTATDWPQKQFKKKRSYFEFSKDDIFDENEDYCDKKDKTSGENSERKHCEFEEVMLDENKSEELPENNSDSKKSDRESSASNKNTEQQDKELEEKNHNVVEDCLQSLSWEAAETLETSQETLRKNIEPKDSTPDTSKGSLMDEISGHTDQDYFSVQLESALRLQEVENEPSNNCNNEINNGEKEKGGVVNTEEMKQTEETALVGEIENSEFCSQNEDSTEKSDDLHKGNDQTEMTSAKDEISDEIVDIQTDEVQNDKNQSDQKSDENKNDDHTDEKIHSPTDHDSLPVASSENIIETENNIEESFMHNFNLAPSSNILVQPPTPGTRSRASSVPGSSGSCSDPENLELQNHEAEDLHDLDTYSNQGAPIADESQNDHANIENNPVETGSLNTQMDPDTENDQKASHDHNEIETSDGNKFDNVIKDPRLTMSLTTLESTDDQREGRSRRKIFPQIRLTRTQALQWEKRNVEISHVAHCPPRRSRSLSRRRQDGDATAQVSEPKDALASNDPRKRNPREPAAKDPSKRAGTRVVHAPAPNLKNVKSRVNSLSNAGYKPGGGRVKIESRPVDVSKATARVQAKSDYKPGGSNKKIENRKMEWRAESKVGSLTNAGHKPGGGNVKIDNKKLNFSELAEAKVGSKENADYKPSGSNIKASDASPSPLHSETEQNLKKTTEETSNHEQNKRKSAEQKTSPGQEDAKNDEHISSEDKEALNNPSHETSAQQSKAETDTENPASIFAPSSDGILEIEQKSEELHEFAINSQKNIDDAKKTLNEQANDGKDLIGSLGENVGEVREELHDSAEIAASLTENEAVTAA